MINKNLVYDYIYKLRRNESYKVLIDNNYKAKLYSYYKKNPIDFIETWLDTTDPRDTERATKPFLLFPIQKKFVSFLHNLVKNPSNALVEKSRDVGASWIACSFAIWLLLFHNGISVGFGSRKMLFVDKINNPDSIFQKLRDLLKGLPPFFVNKNFVQTNVTFMNIYNPDMESSITGEGGDSIGRGGRKTIYFKDESAFYERSESIDSALSSNTDIQVDISSVNGVGNLFHRKREAGIIYNGYDIIKGKINVFIIDWRDDPRKDMNWYDLRKQEASEVGLLHKFHQEIDRDYYSSLSNVLISKEWVLSSFEASGYIKEDSSNAAICGFDVADEGTDTNALSVRKGVFLKDLLEWGSIDTGESCLKVLDYLKFSNLYNVEVQYDSIGVGAGIKSTINSLNKSNSLPKGFSFVPWNASTRPLNYNKRMVPNDKQSPLISDIFMNLKSQGWFLLARRFELTYKVISYMKVGKEIDFNFSLEDLIILPKDLKLKYKLINELCQVTKRYSSNSKMVIEKTPEGTKSPNLADSLMMCFHPLRLPKIRVVDTKDIR